MEQFRLYPRGFVITRETIDSSLLPETYKHVNILGDVDYYFDGDAPAMPAPDIAIDNERNAFLIVHGNCVHVRADTGEAKPPSAEHLLNLHRRNESSFLDTLDFLGGRFAIIAGDSRGVRIYQDAVGMRSVYYSTTHKIASSHLYLLNDCLPHTPDPLDRPSRNRSIMFNQTSFLDIKSCLPNFYLDFNEQRLVRFFPRGENKYTKLSDEEKISLVEKLLKSEFSYCFDTYGTIVLALTGGTDSRVSLAFAKNQIENLQTFTHAYSGKRPKSLAGQMRIQDEDIVSQILGDIPLNHMILKKNTNNQLTEEQLAIVDRNTFRYSANSFLPLYTANFPDENTFYIPSQFHEIGQCYFRKRGLKNYISSIKTSYHRRLRSLGSVDDIKDAMGDFFEQGIELLGYEGELYGYEMLDLFYWEERMGRWMAEVMNETDVAFEPFIPYNMRVILDISLSFEQPKRLAG